MFFPPVILDYLFSTSPSRLQVGTATAAATGRIDVSVSSGSTDKYCKQIMLAVPIGTEATDFSENTPTAAVNTANWSVSSAEIVTGTDLGLETDASFASFTFDAKDSSVYKIDYNLVFSLSATVNETVGSFAYIVRETSGTDATTLTEKQSTFELDKVPPSFYLDNLVATTTASPLVPSTEFANGAAIRLAWESNGTWFKVYEKANATPIYSGTAKTITVSGGAATDTTYFLLASMTGDPSNDAGGFEPIYLFDSVTVTITNPDLTPKTVAVSGVFSAGGATNLKDTSVDGKLGVAGATSLKDINVGGALGVAGATSLKDTTVGGTLSVTNSTGLKNTSVDGTLVVNGALTGSGSASLSNLTVTGSLNARSAPVNMFGTGVKLAEGASIPNTRVLAKTDGFAVAEVLTPGTNDKSSFAYAQIFTAGNWFQILGGTVGSFGSDWRDVMNYNPNTMCLPISGGSYWQYYAANAGGNQLGSPSRIWWFPMGGSSQSEVTYRIVPEHEVTDLVAPPVMPDSDFLDRREARQEDLLKRLAKLLGSLDDDVRVELATLLQQR